jgi:hypothetical protein
MARMYAFRLPDFKHVLTFGFVRRHCRINFSNMGFSGISNSRTLQACSVAFL